MGDIAAAAEPQKIFLKVFCLEVSTTLKKRQVVKTVVNQARNPRHPQGTTICDEVLEEVIVERWFPFVGRTDDASEEQNPLLRKMEPGTKFSRVIKSLLASLVEHYDGPSQRDDSNNGGLPQPSRCSLYSTSSTPEGLGAYLFQSEDEEAEFDIGGIIEHNATAEDLGLTSAEHGNPMASVVLLLKFFSKPTEEEFKAGGNAKLVDDHPQQQKEAPDVASVPHEKLEPRSLPSSNDVEATQRSIPPHPKPVAVRPSIAHVTAPRITTHSQPPTTNNTPINHSRQSSGGLPSTLSMGPARMQHRQVNDSLVSDRSVCHLEPWPTVMGPTAAFPTRASHHRPESHRGPERSVMRGGGGPRGPYPGMMQTIHFPSRQQPSQAHNSEIDISTLRKALEEERRRRYDHEYEGVGQVPATQRSSIERTFSQQRNINHHHPPIPSESDIDELAMKEHLLLMEQLKNQRPHRRSQSRY